jgi:hypothetical protein
MTQMRHCPESRRGIVRSLPARRDFETETAPEDSHAARQDRYAGFGDAEYPEAHRRQECKPLSKARMLKTKDGLASFLRTSPDAKARL